MLCKAASTGDLDTFKTISSRCIDGNTEKRKLIDASLSVAGGSRQYCIFNYILDNFGLGPNYLIQNWCRYWCVYYGDIDGLRSLSIEIPKFEKWILGNGVDEVPEYFDMKHVTDLVICNKPKLLKIYLTKHLVTFSATIVDVENAIWVAPCKCKQCSSSDEESDMESFDVLFEFVPNSFRTRYLKSIFTSSLRYDNLTYFNFIKERLEINELLNDRRINKAVYSKHSEIFDFWLANRDQIHVNGSHLYMIPHIGSHDVLQRLIQNNMLSSILCYNTTYYPHDPIDCYVAISSPDIYQACFDEVRAEKERGGNVSQCLCYLIASCSVLDVQYIKMMCETHLRHYSLFSRKVNNE